MKRQEKKEHCKMQNRREEYEARVATATPLGLVIINYELLIYHIENSISTIATEDFYSNLENALTANGLLMDSLDLGYEIGRDLMSVYVYVNKLLIDARFANISDTSKSLKLLEEAKDIISSLLESWQEISKEDNGLPVSGSSKIYGGLTYRNGKLSEFVVESDQNDFKA